MPNFITCWLRDPGDLPTDDGPPGGGGQGGPPGGGDDPPCDATVDYYGCTLPDNLEGDWQGECTTKVTLPVSDFNSDCDPQNTPECITLPVGDLGAYSWCKSQTNPACVDECNDDNYPPPGGPGDNPCPTLVCEDPGCDPTPCVAGRNLTEAEWTQCGWSQDSEGNCLGSPGGCSIDEGGGEFTTFYAPDQAAICQAQCVEDCPTCPSGYLCQENQGEFAYGNCNQVAECSGTYNQVTESCDYPDNCFETKEECLETGCTCKNFVGCSLAYSEIEASCVSCGVSGAEVDPETGNVIKCLYDNESSMFPNASDPALATITCQQFYDEQKGGLYYFEAESEADEAVKLQQCNTNCVVGNDKCYTCSGVDCYQCEDITGPFENEKPFGKTCQPVKQGAATCVDSGNKPTNNNGVWECGTGEYKDSDCDDECIDCETGGYYEDPDCNYECNGLSGFGGQFGLGGQRGHLRIYGSLFSNGVYQKNINNTKSQVGSSFLPVSRGSLRQDLFKSKVHIGIRACIEISNNIIPFSDRPFSDLSDSNLEKSIHDHIIQKLNEARNAEGRPIKEKIISTLRELIISNRLDEFDVNAIVSMADRIIQISKDVKYAKTREPFTDFNTDSIGNEAKAIELVTDTIWPLKNSGYTTTVSERMRYWKTLAPDLEKHLPVRTADGTVTPFYYDINDHVVLNSSGTMTLSPGDLQRYTKSDGTIGEIPIQSLIDRAGVLSIESLQRVMALLGDSYNFTMTVTSDPTLRIDERYGVANARRNFYMLTLETSTIQDLPRNNSFVARTKAQYKYEDDGPTRNQHVGDKPFPYLELYVDAQDPIFNYITNDGVIEVESKDFVFDIFNDDGLPVIPRRGPVPTIILYPTDRTAKVVSHSISKHDSYGVRKITFDINPDPDVSDNWQATFLRERTAYPDKGISVTEENLRSLKYSVNTIAINNQNLYRTGEPVLPRLKFGTRYAYSIAKELKDDYELPSNNIVEWYEIYERMPVPMMKYMHRECTNFKNFTSLLAIGKVSNDESVNALYPRLREVKSQNWLGNKDETTTRPLSYLKVKEGHTPIPPTPID